MVSTSDLPAPTTAATASINGLQLYHEVYGEGPPIVLLHGAYGSVADWYALIPTLLRTHCVIVADLQAHGRTSDVARPITYEAMADDIDALLAHLDVEQVAVFGYSMGAGVAFQLALRHPERVGRLVIASGSISDTGFPEGFHEMIEGMSPATFAGSPMEAGYLANGRTEAEFAELVRKLIELDLQPFDWPEDAVAEIEGPTLLVFGDADIVMMDHVAKLHRLLGGVANGDINGLPKLQLAVLPGTTHVGVVTEPHNVDLLRTIVPRFLTQDLPVPPPDA